MITRVRVKNFRSLADIDVTLGPLLVLVGRNGAGKSAFIDALRFVRDALRSNLDEAIRKRDGLGRLLHWKPDGSCGDIAFEFSIQQEAFTAEYGFAISSEPQAAYSVTREYLRVDASGESPKTVYEIEKGKWKIAPSSSAFPMAALISSSASPTLDATQLMLPLLVPVIDVLYVAHFLRASNFYGVFPLDTLRRPQKKLHYFPLFEDGTNLASTLQQMAVTGVLPTLTASMKAALDDVEKIHANSLGSYLTIQMQHKSRAALEDGPVFELAQESEGTIHLLAVLTAFYQSLLAPPSTFSVIAVEEPETGLYPATLSVVADVVKEAAGRSQVIVTTQSPDFISEFDVDQLRIVEMRKGSTHIGMIDEVQRGIINDQLFTTGDLLRVEGLRSLPAEPVSANNA